MLSEVNFTTTLSTPFFSRRRAKGGGKGFVTAQASPASWQVRLRRQSPLLLDNAEDFFYGG